MEDDAKLTRIASDGVALIAGESFILGCGKRTSKVRARMTGDN